LQWSRINPWKQISQTKSYAEKGLIEWELNAMLSRIGLNFRDFLRYRLKVDENIGESDVAHFNARDQQQDTTEKGMAENCQPDRGKRLPCRRRL
jgi:hypothetical protein